MLLSEEDLEQYLKYNLVQWLMPFLVYVLIRVTLFLPIPWAIGRGLVTERGKVQVGEEEEGGTFFFSLNPFTTERFDTKVPLTLAILKMAIS